MDLDFIVGKCLAKEPGDRPATAQEVVRELRTLADKVKSGRSTVFSVAGGAAGSMAARPPVVAGGRSKRERLAWGIAALLAVGLAVLAVLYFGQPSPELETSRFEIAPPSGIRFARRAAQISPDGRHLVFVGMSGRNVRSLWIRSMDSVEARPLNGTEGADEPFWSPDSRFVGFFADGKLKKIDIAGGPAQTLCDASAGRGGTWAAGATGDTGVIVFAATALGSLQEVSDAGGEPAAVTILDVESGDRSHRFPHFLPDGQRFLYTARTAGRSEVRVGSLDERPGGATKKHEPILIADTPVRYAPPPAGKGNGYLLFAREDSLMAQELDLDRLKLTGQPVPVAEGVGESTSGRRRGNDFSASQKGTLTYRAGDSEEKAQLNWFNRDGKRGEAVGEPGLHGGMVSLSPDDSKVTTTLFGDEILPNGDLWIHDLSRGVASRFTFHPSQEISNVWSPDGKRIVFSSNREGQYDLYLKPTSGAGDAELLLHNDFIKGPRSWSPDGKTILYAESTGRGDYDLWTLPLDGDRKPAPYLRTEFSEVLGQFSPDGRWVAYVSNESGRDEVYVQPDPASGGKWQVSTDGGSQPRWRADGKELFYLAPGDTMMAAPIEADVSFRPGVPAELFRVNGIVVPAGAGSYFHYDVTKDGQRFLIDVTSEEGEQTPLTVVQNWQAELGR
jgi:Tol biopolymer transport system component